MSSSSTTPSPISNAERQRRYREKKRLSNTSRDEYEKKEACRKRKARAKVHELQLVILYRWKSTLDLGVGIMFVDRLAAFIDITDSAFKLLYDRAIISSGNTFNDAVSDMIIEAKEIVLLLYNSCFSRCEEDEDFFSWEIATALQSKKPMHIFVYDTTIQEMQQELRNIPERVTWKRELEAKLRDAQMTHITSEHWNADMIAFLKPKITTKKPKTSSHQHNEEEEEVDE